MSGACAIATCCCGCRESPLCEVRHVCLSSHGHQHLAVAAAILKMRKYAISLRPLLSSKSFKNDSNYKHSWSGGFLYWSANINCSSKTQVIIRIFGVVDFGLDRLILRLFIFPTEILKFWSDHGLYDFASFSYLLYFQLKSTLFGASMDSQFSTIFHFCYTSLLIFTILMLILENLNISKDQ